MQNQIWERSQSDQVFHETKPVSLLWIKGLILFVNRKFGQLVKDIFIRSSASFSPSVVVKLETGCGKREKISDFKRVSDYQLIIPCSFCCRETSVKPRAVHISYQSDHPVSNKQNQNHLGLIVVIIHMVFFSLLNKQDMLIPLSGWLYCQRFFVNDWRRDNFKALSLCTFLQNQNPFHFSWQ